MSTDSRAFLINFPTPTHATATAFPDVASATKAAEKLTDGSRFVLGSVTEKTLGVMTGSMLMVLYQSLNPEAKNAKAKITGKKDLIQRLVPLIPEAAASTTPETESESMSDEAKQETNAATKSGKATKATKATKSAAKPKAKATKLPKADPKATKSAAKSTTKKSAPAGGRGRASGFEGKKLTVAASNEYIARMRADSRRTQSLKKIKSGMKYEDAIKAGAHKHDIAIMVKQGQLKVS